MAKKEPPYGYPLDASLNRGRAHHHHPGIGTKTDPHPADDDDFDSRSNSIKTFGTCKIELNSCKVHQTSSTYNISGIFFYY